MTQQLRKGLYWLNDCYEVIKGSDRHIHSSVYLIEDSDKHILVDTGAAHHRERIHSAINEFTDELDAILITKAHPPHAENLSTFYAALGEPEIVATSGLPEIYGFMPPYVDRVAKTKDGYEVPVAGATFEFIDPVLFDMAHSTWIYHESTETLFTADGLGNYHADGECAMTSTDLEGGIAFEEIADFHREMVVWLKYVHPTKLFEALEAIFERKRISTVAPAHGNPILDDDIPAYLDHLSRSFEEIAGDFTLPPTR